MIVAFYALSMPAPLLGMLILFGLLHWRLLRPEWLDSAAQNLIKYLAFFFIPVGVGVLNHLDLLLENIFLISILLFALPAVVLVVVGKFSSRGRYRD
ncbi:CidA/LrgA family protein [Pseudoalteromonas sp. SMS1]|uniref:CidA/LrgA family protein n=1 Tax=Pseudoalteromonas sp. SMS1 TaxID=2908894 RepID=UPI001F1C331B|nr:CidA/LrgA family protein [Pseudoalteromonas sp. SMS1]MCF2856287.1 CidA/LrgA family protein [Pseudoalteromonas sp. SMS1]